MQSVEEYTKMMNASGDMARIKAMFQSKLAESEWSEMVRNKCIDTEISEEAAKKMTNSILESVIGEIPSDLRNDVLQTVKQSLATIANEKNDARNQKSN